MGLSLEANWLPDLSGNDFHSDRVALLECRAWANSGGSNREAAPARAGRKDRPTTAPGAAAHYSGRQAQCVSYARCALLLMESR